MGIGHIDESSLAPSLAIGNLLVYYQPQIDLRTGIVCGLEALARWQDPKLGILSPSDFFPLVEESCMMKWLTANVLNEVLDQLVAWKGRNIDLTVSVNLEAETLEDESFVAWLRQELTIRKIDPSRLTLEIVEETVVDSEIAIRALHELRSAGFQLSMDDYGTGYSCLCRLRDLPVTEAKIDKTFIGRAAADWRTLRIIRAMVDLAHDLGVAVVAEGIETELARTAARGVGCDKGQGYFYGQPVPASDVEIIVGSHRPA